VNRTDRLYALVEELRGVAPRPRSSGWLAERFEVSRRTIERDLSTLQQAGVPIWAETGRTGGYCLDPSHTLAPLGFTLDEALALVISLGMLSASPFHTAARSALNKVVAVMDDRKVDETADLASRVLFLRDEPPPKLADGLAEAFRSGTVLRIEYQDRQGSRTTREVEPLGYVGRDGSWYLVAWCRLRNELRAFKGDRISAATPTGERPPRRPFDRGDLEGVYGHIEFASLKPDPS
jgi:predicted DNA-binding transcriptional regulator YafY